MGPYALIFLAMAAPAALGAEDTYVSVQEILGEMEALYPNTFKGWRDEIEKGVKVNLTQAHNTTSFLAHHLYSDALERHKKEIERTEMVIEKTHSELNKIQKALKQAVLTLKRQNDSLSEHKKKVLDSKTTLRKMKQERDLLKNQQRNLTQQHEFTKMAGKVRLERLQDAHIKAISALARSNQVLSNLTKVLEGSATQANDRVKGLHEKNQKAAEVVDQGEEAMRKVAKEMKQVEKQIEAEQDRMEESEHEVRVLARELLTRQHQLELQGEKYTSMKKAMSESLRGTTQSLQNSSAGFAEYSVALEKLSTGVKLPDYLNAVRSNLNDVTKKVEDQMAINDNLRTKLKMHNIRIQKAAAKVGSKESEDPCTRCLEKRQQMRSIGEDPVECRDCTEPRFRQTSQTSTESKIESAKKTLQEYQTIIGNMKNLEKQEAKSLKDQTETHKKELMEIKDQIKSVQSAMLDGHKEVKLLHLEVEELRKALEEAKEDKKQTNSQTADLEMKMAKITGHRRGLLDEYKQTVREMTETSKDTVQRLLEKSGRARNVDTLPVYDENTPTEAPAKSEKKLSLAREGEKKEIPSPTTEKEKSEEDVKENLTTAKGEMLDKLVEEHTEIDTVNPCDLSHSTSVTKAAAKANKHLSVREILENGGTAEDLVALLGDDSNNDNVVCFSH